MRASDRSAPLMSAAARPPAVAVRGRLAHADGGHGGGWISGASGLGRAAADSGCPGGAGTREGLGRVACCSLGGCLLASDGGPPQCLGAEQDQPVDEQQDRRGGGLGEQDPEGVLECDADQADRDRREDDHPGEPLVLVRHGQPQPPVLQGQPHAGGQAAEEPPDDPDPVGAEEPHQRQGRRAVQRHDVGQVERAFAAGLGGLGDQGLPAAAEPRRDQHGMAQAGYREQLGDALDERDHECLQVSHGRSFVIALGGSASQPWAARGIAEVRFLVPAAPVRR